ncbi:DUF1344 domain-containing protein [Rhizobium sp. KVB221]|uniref:DUF1344 domain-containing protein n=1 Tax=Rhizobium setariae TaxID=2801340 RepID=A0A937CQ49_9HYPH|nr:DUF1344 domain-containing protein [Rhizobium setariae]MBL0373974.1 DUF1344 domain-containing protein [Rhizobium setariae]
MPKAIVLAAAAAVALTAFDASAATMSGVVKSIDKARDAIRLTDGSSYVLSEGSEAEDFKPGSKVSITYSTKHGQNVASSVKILK